MTDIAAYFILAIGVFALAAAVLQLRGAWRVRAWSAVPGRIVERDVVPATATSTGTSNGPRYELRVR